MEIIKTKIYYLNSFNPLAEIYKKLWNRTNRELIFPELWEDGFHIMRSILDKEIFVDDYFDEKILYVNAILQIKDHKIVRIYENELPNPLFNNLNE